MKKVIEDNQSTSYYFEVPDSGNYVTVDNGDRNITINECAHLPVYQCFSSD